MRQKIDHVRWLFSVVFLVFTENNIRLAFSTKPNAIEIEWEKKFVWAKNVALTFINGTFSGEPLSLAIQ